MLSILTLELGGDDDDDDDDDDDNDDVVVVQTFQSPGDSYG